MEAENKEHHNQYPEKLNDSKGETKSQTDYIQLIVFCFNLAFANKCNEIMNNSKFVVSSENIQPLNKCPSFKLKLWIIKAFNLFCQ